MVKTVFLNCQEGELRWQQPEGAMLVRFQPPQNVQDAYVGSQLCWRFKDAESVGAKATVLRNRVLQKSQDVTAESPIQCETYEPTSRLSLYIVSQPVQPNTNNRLSLVYEFVRTSRDVGSNCRACTDEAFVKAYCASDFGTFPYI
ncbi:meteoringlial cell differentiation regulator-like precursor [Aphelenchoides avenae]|nr:meteoringlial cell differentiation regulator-like precursor [Aphelenchus avenae]